MHSSIPLKLVPLFLTLSLLGVGCFSASKMDSPSEVRLIPPTKILPVTPTTTIIFEPGFRFQYPISQNSPVCTQDPTTSDIGSVDYPVAAQYEVYDRFFGSLLTQYQCPNARRNVAIGTSGMYDLGMSLRLKQAPSPAMLQTMKRIGFYCNEEQSEDVCMSWKLIGEVPVYNIIHLEPFTNEVKSSDCVNCG